jgi:hypothetical protein
MIVVLLQNNSGKMEFGALKIASGLAVKKGQSHENLSSGD